LGGGCPMTAGAAAGGYVHYAERVEGHKVRERSESFKDHFSQATMFWHSITPDEQDRLVDAGRYELCKVCTMEIWHRMVHEFFNRINHELAVRIAQGVGVEPPAAFAGQETDKRIPEVSVIKRGRYDTIATRKVAILLADGFDHGQFMAVKEMLMDGGAKPKVVAKMQGDRKSTRLNSSH